MKKLTSHLSIHSSYSSKIKMISAIATLASVLLLVAAVPLFVNAQTGNPPTNNVDATFHSVTVNDGASDNLLLQSDGSINNPSLNGVVIDDFHGFSVEAEDNSPIINVDSGNGFSVNNVTGQSRFTISRGGYMTNPHTDATFGRLYFADDQGSFFTNSSGSINGLKIDSTGRLQALGSQLSFIDSQGFSLFDDTGANEWFRVGSNGVISNPSGDVTINDFVDIQNSISNSSGTNGGAVGVNDADGFSVTSGLNNTFKIDGTGQITNPSGSNSGAVYVNDTLWTKTLTAMNTSSAGIFTVDSNTGNTTIFGGLKVTGITDLMNIAAGSTTVTDLTSTGTIDAKGGINNSSTSAIWPYLGLPVSITDTMGLSVSGPTSLQSSLSVSGSTSLNGGVSGNLSVGGNITSSGKITSSGGIGTINSISHPTILLFNNIGAGTTLNPTVASVTVTCATGAQLLSCGLGAANNNGIYQHHIDTFSTSCTVYAANTGAAGRIFAEARCFNPSV